MTSTKIFHYISNKTSEEITNSLCSKLPIKISPIQNIQALFPLLSCPTFHTDFVVIDIASEGHVTITLPPNESGCQQIIVKAEMGPPLGNRKVTIVCSGSGTIDGEPSYVMTTPYESVQLFNDGIGSWFVI